MLFALDPRSAPPRPTTAAELALGARLFETGFGERSCSQCHTRSGHGQDGRTHERNTPALADVSRQLVLGWDGHGSDLRATVAAELARRTGVSTDADATRWVAGDIDLQAAFENVHPGAPPTRDRLIDALVVHLDHWRTRGRWDDFVEGDDAALSAAERAGLATFVEVGCAACHAGRTLGGRSRHKLGAALPYETDDTGLAAVTGETADRYFFKAPMLRLAATTGPYLHDGSVDRLDAAVRLMARHELAREIADSDVTAIVTFLRATADVDSVAARPPR